MDDLRTLDVTDEPTFALVPPCADPGFDHRSCDYWEDDGARLEGGPPGLAGALRGRRGAAGRRRRTGNPFLDDLDAAGVSGNPFARAGRPRPRTRSSTRTTTRRSIRSRRRPRPDRPSRRPRRASCGCSAVAWAWRAATPRCCVQGERTVAYCQFGPLTAYPRAQRIRDLYPSLPVSPLPAVITCISTVAEGRGEGHGRRLVEAVCEDLAAPRVRRGGGVPGARDATGRDERRDAGVLGGGRVRPRHRRSAVSGHASRARVRRGRSRAAAGSARRSRSRLWPRLTVAACAGPTLTTAPVDDAVAGRDRRPRLGARSPVGRRSSWTRACSTCCPSQVAGIDLVSDPATAASIASDPDLATIASAIAVALAIEPGRLGRRRPRRRQRRPAPAGRIRRRLVPVLARHVRRGRLRAGRRRPGQRPGRDRGPRHVHRHVRPGRVHLPRHLEDPDRPGVDHLGRRGTARRAGRGRPRRVGFGHGRSRRGLPTDPGRSGPRAAPS